MSQWGYQGGGNPSGASEYGEPYERERGARRKKIAAMAGSVYRAGVAAASEIRDQYSNPRIRGVVNIDESASKITIPGSFPDVAIVVKGDEQMVLFPSYAKRHIRQFDDNSRSTTTSSTQANMNDEDYWRHEWARMEDKKAITDVDVRGWVYSPQKGAMTRRNRVLVGLARRLSGIPAPTTSGPESMTTLHEDHEDLREQQKIAREAEQIERKGQAEKEAAVKGSYSEEPREDDSDADSGRYSPRRTRSGARTPLSAPSSPTLSARPSANAVAELTEQELAVANANLMARLGPFMTTPLVQLPITIFFYNDETSASRTVTTSDAGHFSVRAALDFVPTHVRVLANETLSATEPVQIIENTGISLISDIDDTIKKSSISLGAREIFRNTFIRDLADLTVEGVREWYGALHDMGVSLHYCSNSPWQLFPVIATFFKTAGLPPGSLHLKQYSGMLQGIFEPVAERKKGTLEKILRDFPERKFLLVGDSGEADLEVYTDLVVANPKRILAVFIRDVTTPEKAGYFDAGFDPAPRRTKTASSRIRVNSGDSKEDDPSQRPNLPPRLRTEPAKTDGPVMGTLIDFSDEPEEMTTSESQNLAQLMGNTALKPNNSAVDLLNRKTPPPRPVKPAALRGSPSEISVARSGISAKSDPTPPGSRKPTGPTHPLSQMLNSSDPTLSSNYSLPKTREVASTPTSKASSNTAKSTSTTNADSEKPPPPPPRRRGTPSSILSMSPRLLAHRRTNSSSDLEGLEALPAAGFTVNPGGGNPNAGPINKKLDMWRRRLERAHDTLDQYGVKLYTWRKGDDVIHEAIGIVKEAMAKRRDR